VDGGPSSCWVLRMQILGRRDPWQKVLAGQAIAKLREAKQDPRPAKPFESKRRWRVVHVVKGWGLGEQRSLDLIWSIGIVVKYSYFGLLVFARPQVFDVQMQAYLPSGWLGALSNSSKNLVIWTTRGMQRGTRWESFQGTFLLTWSLCIQQSVQTESPCLARVGLVGLSWCGSHGHCARQLAAL